MLTSVQQPPTLPAQPSYIFRGHGSQIHALRFFAENSRLATADADGWVVVWSVAIKRPVAVWKAHEGSVLALGEWNGKIITHGRDNKLFVWRLEEAGMDVLLPVQDGKCSRRKPWLVASLDVNALNFCGFAQCVERGGGGERLLVAVPSALNSDNVDIMRLSGGERVHASVGTTEVKTGMAMALSMYYCGGALVLVGGYESGHAVVYKWDEDCIAWSVVYTHKPHSQPVLSLSVSPFQESSSPYFLTSSADAIIAKHPLPNPALPPSTPPEPGPTKIVNTKHSGQQSVTIRSDGRIFATAGWDSRIRVYSAKTMKELAVLKWHREGCYAVAFGDVLGSSGVEGSSSISSEGAEGCGRVIVTVEEDRRDKVRASHWVVGGAKDGKVSLWEIY